MVTPLRLAFFGTPTFALTVLQRVQRSPHPVALVVTQPDRPRGRGQKLTPGPIKARADACGIPVLQPEDLRDDFIAAMSAHAVDLAVVAAYGRILPQLVLDLPRLGTINVHGSLLPRWRGAAPVHRAVLAGDTETGITIMRVVLELDAGPTLARERVPIGPNETSGALYKRLAEVGGDLLVRTLDQIAAGPVAEEPQLREGVTYADRLHRRESRVDWARPALVIHNQIRGLQPWPAAAVLFRDRRLRLLGSEVAHDRQLNVEPGVVCDVTPDGFAVAAQPGAVRIMRVQQEGRSPTGARDFLAGHRLVPGDRLDPVSVRP